MRRINNAKEFKEFYPYKSPPNKSPCPPVGEYPKAYPCFADIVHEDGGIGGDYMWVNIVYPPTGCNLRDFRAGLDAT